MFKVGEQLIGPDGKYFIVKFAGKYEIDLSPVAPIKSKRGTRDDLVVTYTRANLETMVRKGTYSFSTRQSANESS